MTSVSRDLLSLTASNLSLTLHISWLHPDDTLVQLPQSNSWDDQMDTIVQVDHEGHPGLTVHVQAGTNKLASDLSNF